MFKDWGSCVEKVGAFEVAKLNCLEVIFQNAVAAAFFFVGIVALFMLVFGGFKFMFSGGDPKEVEAARHVITWAIIGLVVVLLAFFLINIIGYITGTESILNQFRIPPP